MPLLRLKKRLSTWTVAIVLTWGCGVLADDRKPTDEARDQAADSFKTGQALFGKGQHLEAAAAFERAYALRPHPSVLANIGYCYDAAGDYSRAVEAFRQYMRQPNPHDRKFNDRTAKRLKSLESKVGDLHVNCHSMRCEVFVDNMSRGLTPTDLVLLAGVHELEVVAIDGAQKRHYEVTVRGGGESILDVDLASSSPETPRGSTSFSVDNDSKGVEASPRLRAPFWVATITTIVGIGAATVVGVMDYKNFEDFKNGGSTDLDLQARGENLNLGTDIAIGLTSAAAVTAIILAIVDLKRKPNQDDDGRGTALSPVFSADPTGAAYVGMSVRFQ